MMRVLDIDLDFFVTGVAHNRVRGAGRLDGDQFPAWEPDEALKFLSEKCRLTKPLPGVVLEHHADLFWWWRDRIRESSLGTPFGVTHVDAHADLGLGDNGYRFLMTQLLHQDIGQRQDSPDIAEHLTDGNFLTFAAACGWLERITYVRNEPFGPPVAGFPSKRFGHNDLPGHWMKGRDLDADAIQLYSVDPKLFKKMYSGTPALREDPEIPFSYVPGSEYRAEDLFDIICLTRSPDYTPPACDAIYDAIRGQFIDESALA